MTGVNAQDRLPAAPLRPIYHHLAIKATGTQKRRVEDIRTVGGSKDHDGIVWLETVQLHQQLFQCMLTLIIAGQGPGTTARAPNSIDLINENNAGGVLACLLKQIAHTAGSHPDEEFDKVGRARAEERHSCLSGDCTRQQGLAGTRWANQQDTPGDMRSDLDVALWVTQEVDHLTKFHLGLINTCHIPECCLWAFFLVEHGTAASNANE